MSNELEARVDAVKRFVTATQGEAAASAKVATLRTVGDLRRAEQEVAAALPSLRNTVKAPASPPAVAAAVPQPQAGGRVTEEEYQGMTAAERLDYCRRFPQGG